MTAWLAPNYLKQFRCIGASCEDTCCANWEVEIDAPTAEGYRNCPDPTLAQQFHQALIPLPHSNGLAKFRLTALGQCPFLAGDKLCEIQRRLGEPALSETCSLFPRVQNSVFGNIELSASISCPEVARLALLSEDALELQPASPDDSPRRRRIDNFPRSASSFLTTSPTTFFSIRDAAFLIIRNRALPINYRLILLGMLIQRLAPLFEEPSGEVTEASNREKDDLTEKALRRTIRGFLEETGGASALTQLDGIPEAASLRISILHGIAAQRIAVGNAHPRFALCYSEFFAGLALDDTSNAATLDARYRDAAHRFLAPFNHQHPYFFENYLLNNLLRTVFPASGNGSLFDDFMMVAVQFATIRLILVGLAAHRERLTTEDAILVVQSFARTIEHNAQFLNGIHALLATQGLTTMGHMAILLKS